MEKVFTRIDVSKDTLDAVIYTSNTKWQFSNNDTGISQLIEAFCKLDPTLVLVETTGGYEAR